MKQLLVENIAVEVMKENLSSTLSSKINAIGREVSQNLRYSGKCCVVPFVATPSHLLKEICDLSFSSVTGQRRCFFCWRSWRHCAQVQALEG